MVATCLCHEGSLEKSVSLSAAAFVVLCNMARSITALDRLLKRYLKRAALTPPTKTMATFVEDFPRPFKVDDVKEFYRADGGRSQLWSIRPEGAHSLSRFRIRFLVLYRGVRLGIPTRSRWN